MLKKNLIPFSISPILAGTYLLFAIFLEAETTDTPILSRDLSVGRTAAASIQNSEDLSIIEKTTPRAITALSSIAETDFNASQTFGRPSSDATTARAEIQNQGNIDVSTLGFAFSSGISTQASASIRVTSANGESNAMASAFGSISNEGEIHLINGGQGLGTKINVKSSSMTTAQAPNPARSFASATGDGSILNKSDVTISNPNLSFSHGITSDVTVESSAVGVVFWPILPSGPPDPLLVILETEAKARADGRVENHGNLSLDVSGFGSGSGIHSRASSISSGVSAFSHSDASVTNRGDISILISDAFASYGINTTARSESNAREDGDLSGISLANVENYGKIDLQVVSGTGAYGIYARAELAANSRGGTVKDLVVDNSVANYGSVQVLSLGSAEAYGIYTSNSVPVNLETDLFSIVKNEGTIWVDSRKNGAASSSGDATGIYFEDGGVLHSSGLIDAHSESGLAYQVVSEKELKINAYAISFGPDVKEEYLGVIRSEEPVYFDNTILYARISDDLMSGTYEIPDLVEGDWQRSGDPNSKEQFSSVINKFNVPDFDVHLLPASSSSGQQVDIRYAPSASIANKSMRLSGDLIQQATSRSQRSLLSSTVHTSPFNGGSLANNSPVGTKRLATAGKLYGSPTYSNSRIESEPVGYRADTYGFELGYQYQFSSRINLGLVGGFGESSIDFTGTGFDSRRENQMLYYGGLIGTYKISAKIDLLGTLLYYETSNKYDNQSPTNEESADYHGKGLNSSINIAYNLPTSSKKHSLKAILGISSLWQDRNSFVTQNKAGFDTHYHRTSENNFYSHLGVDWRSHFNLYSWSITPQLSVEARRVLGHDDIMHRMSLGSSSAIVNDIRDVWLYEGSGSIGVHKDNLSLTAGISLYKIDNACTHGIRLSFGYEF